MWDESKDYKNYLTLSRLSEQELAKKGDKEDCLNEQLFCQNENLKKIIENYLDNLTEKNSKEKYIFKEEKQKDTTRLKSIAIGEENIIREIRLPNGNVYSLENDGESLEIHNAEVLDIRWLKGIKRLKKLVIYTTKIENIEFLSEFENLEELKLFNCEIKNISAMKNLSKLKYLDLCRNRIDDIGALAGLNNLLWLDLSENQIEDITPLKEMKKLESLFLSWNEIADIQVLAELENLENLYLDYNFIEDITPLKKMKKLKELNLYQNLIVEFSLVTWKTLLVLKKNNLGIKIAIRKDTLP